MTAIDDPFARKVMASVARFHAALDRFGEPTVTAACELLQLDRLVAKYPAAARTALELHRPKPAPGPIRDWTRIGDVDGLPLWRWTGGRVVCLATADLDQLRFVGAALARFDRMTAEELRAHLGE